MPILLAATILALVGAPATVAAAQSNPSTECAVTLSGAHVFTGAGFETRDLSFKGGLFVASGDGLPRVDASALWLTPPLIDAHTHTINIPAAAADPTHRRWLDEGVFYALNPNNIRPSGPAPAVTNDQVELESAGGGITRPGGHPTQLYAGMADAEGRAFHSVSTPAEARTAVAAVKANGSTFVKLYLVNHEDPGGGEGLSAEAFEAAVDEARKLGLRPIVHIEDASDFRLAVRAHVFALMHMPYWPEGRSLDTLRISAADAEAAARAGILVVPTVIVGTAQFDGPQLSGLLDVQRHNMALLQAVGVRMAVGEDFMGTMHDEIAALRASGLFTAPEMLRMATENGAAIAFPDRHIGRLEPGYEASFLVFQRNPIANWFRLQAPAAGMRAGRVIVDKDGLLAAACAAAG